jgi:hypothetical protein
LCLTDLGRIAVVGARVGTFTDQTAAAETPDDRRAVPGIAGVVVAGGRFAGASDGDERCHEQCESLHESHRIQPITAAGAAASKKRILIGGPEATATTQR